MDGQQRKRLSNRCGHCVHRAQALRARPLDGFIVLSWRRCTHPGPVWPGHGRTQPPAVGARRQRSGTAHPPAPVCRVGANRAALQPSQSRRGGRRAPPWPTALPAYRHGAVEGMPMGEEGGFGLGGRCRGCPCPAPHPPPPQLHRGRRCLPQADPTAIRRDTGHLPANRRLAGIAAAGNLYSARCPPVCQRRWQPRPLASASPSWTAAKYRKPAKRCTRARGQQAAWSSLTTAWCSSPAGRLPRPTVTGARTARAPRL